MLVMTDMHPVQLAGLDLNGLVVLDALLTTRSVALAAARVGLSPSATSHALARLRRTFDDPLLVRGPTGLVPTARAEALAAPLRESLARIGRLVLGDPPFDPATASRSFALGTVDFGAFLLAPPLLAALERRAPGCDVVVRSPDDDVYGALASGALDVYVGPRSGALDRPGLHARTLFDERFVCVVREGHPSLGRRWTPRRFAALEHALIAPRGRPGGAVDAALAELGLERRVRAMLPSFLAAPFVVASTDLVLTLPERVARLFASQLPLVLVTPPVPISGFTMSMLWHERTHRDEGARFFRDAVVEAARTVARAPARAGTRDAGSRRP